MTLSAHLLRRYDKDTLNHLRGELSPGVTFTTGPDPPSPAEFQVLVAGRPERAHLKASPNLRALVIPWAGIPQQTVELLADFPGITVHNLHHNSVPVAEMALTLLLAAAKRVVPMDRALRTNDWTPRYGPNTTLMLEGKTALILGYGAIGRQIARLCRGLGMRVAATLRHLERAPDDSPDEIHPAEHLPELLPRADALIICLPYTVETEGLIGSEELKRLPPAAVLVNVGRGPIVDETALYHALHEGRLHAAGLDVWYNYPKDERSRVDTPPSTCPFHELDNVVMSPHRAGSTVESERLRMVHLARVLNAAARGKPLPNQVDLAAGY
jgi:phosphoglycerate dehydrogenase-like enzyme